MNLRDEGADLERSGGGEQLARHGTGSDAPDRLPGRGAASTAMVADAVFGLMGEISVRRTEAILHFGVGLGARVGVAHQHCQRMPRRSALKNAREKFHAIRLLARGGDFALTRATAVQFDLNVLFRERQIRRAAVDHDSHGRTVAFTPRGDAKQFSERVAHSARVARRPLASKLRLGIVRQMKIFVLSGSHRAEAQSRKVADYVGRAINAEIPGAEAFIFSLSGNPLPLWDEAHGGAPDALWGPVSRELRAADAVVVISPEWSGMATPGVKNFLLNCSAAEVGHKPGLIVAVSAGRGGSYPVAELRMSGTKNNRLTWLPEHVLVQNVENSLNQPDGSPDLAKEDATIRARLRYALRLLGEYAKALRDVRASGVVDHQTFRNGM